MMLLNFKSHFAPSLSYSQYLRENITAQAMQHTTAKAIDMPFVTGILYVDLSFLLSLHKLVPEIWTDC